MRQISTTTTMGAVVRLAATFTGVCALGSASVAQLPNRPSAEVRYVAAGIEAARQNLKCAEAVVTYNELTPKEYSFLLPAASPEDAEATTPTPEGDQETNYKAWWYKQDASLSMYLQRDQKDKQTIWRYKRLVADAKKARLLTQYDDPQFPQNGIYHFGVITSSEVALPDGQWVEHFDLDPRHYAHGTWDQALLKADLPVLYKGEEVVYGSRCAKIEVQQKDASITTFWFDTEHDFLLRKRQDHEMAGGKQVLSSETQVPRVQESNGIWMPVSVDFVGSLFLPKDQLPPKMPLERIQILGNTAILPTKKIHVEIADFRADCVLSPTAFILDWPMGTRITDHLGDQALEAAELSDEEVPYLLSLRSKRAAEAKTTGALPTAEADPHVVIGSAKPTVQVSGVAPDFTVTDMNGQAWRLSELKGKKNLLLTFFPKCFTGGCANHLSALRDQQEAFDAADTQILAVSVDSADGERGQKAFAQQWKLQFPLIPDTTRILSKLFGAVQSETQLSARMSILIDKQGIVRFIDTNVNVKTHGADMITKMRELGLAK